MRCRPCMTSSSLVSFFAPRRNTLVAPLANASETQLVPRLKPWRSVVCSSQPSGRPSSSSANTALVNRIWPNTAMVPVAGSAPPRFCCIKRSARPMLAPAGCCGSGPSKPKPELSRIFFAIGPLTMTTANGLPEVACNRSPIASGSKKASTAAIRTGRYSGRPPAIASAIAQASTVTMAPRGGNLPSTCARGNAAPRMIQLTRSCVAGHSGRPSPQRFAISSSLALFNAAS